MNDFKNFTKTGNIVDFFTYLFDEALLIYSPTSLKKIDFITKTNIHLISTAELSKNVSKLNEKIIGFPPNINLIIAFGGGTAIDIGKYISYKLQKKLIAIPSMLSTNAYSTNKVALILDGHKTTLSAKMPDEILMDYEFLKKSSEFNLYGLVDIFSIYTALYDWKLANRYNKEKINGEIYKQANELLDETLLFVKNNSLSEIEENIEQIYKIVGNAGLITNIYGSGRPESGSEHILAKEIENNLEIHHGISVSVSIIIMSLIQGQRSRDIYNSLLKISVLDNIKSKGITRKFLFEILKKLKIRVDRYSIVDIYCRDDEFINSILDEYEAIVGGKEDVDN